MYRGRCANNDRLETTLKLFLDKQEEIYALVNNLQGLSDYERKKTVRYLNSFYKTIKSEGRVNRELRKACLGG
jgi:hypothetical protein